MFGHQHHTLWGSNCFMYIIKLYTVACDRAVGRLVGRFKGKGKRGFV